MTLDATRKKSGKKLLVMLSSWDGFISSCLLSQFMASHDFNKSWDSITKNRPMPPDYFIDAHPASSGVDIGELMGDMTSPEIDIKDVGGEGDECCADLRTGLANLDTYSENYYDGKLGPTMSAIHDHIDYDKGIEGASCEMLVDALNGAIGSGEYSLEQGGNAVAYHQDYGFSSEAEAMADHRNQTESSEQFQHEMEVLNRLRQLKLEYEACNMIADTGGFEDQDMGFYASADPFELAWDSIRKEEEYVEIEYESGETIQLSFEEFDKIKLDWENDDDIVAVRTYRGDEVSQILKSDESAIEVRDRSLAILASMGLKWDENPLRPQHEMPVHADGRDLSDEEYEQLMEVPAFTEAVWDLTNVWALSDERREQTMEYARRNLIGGFTKAWNLMKSPFRAKHTGNCKSCGRTIDAGEWVNYNEILGGIQCPKDCSKGYGFAWRGE